MKVLGLIPARGGSKGVPKKNKKKLNGKPLVCYSIEAGLASQVIDTLIVSTDDTSIADISRQAGAKVPFLRPAELATDDSPSIATVVHALNFYKDKNIHFDAVCLLQPTCPFRSASDIKDAIILFEKRAADCLISVKEVPHTYNPHWVYERIGKSAYLKIATGEKEIISRRQELPKAYYRDGAIYITRSEIIMKNKSLYGEKITWYQSSNPKHINIDTLSDWAEAERLIQKKEN